LTNEEPTMKIEGNRPNLESVAAQPTGRAATSRAKDAQAGAGAPAQGTDRVQLSEGAALAANAQRVASESPDIRQDLVEQMRAKLAAGEIGKDPEKVADRIIDHLLDS
jgi:flagellar biosynthesis anti-sigma factor FlgM